MKINERMLKSVKEETLKRFGSELPDEVLDIVSGGRVLTSGESRDLFVKLNDAKNNLPDEEYRRYNAAIRKYVFYISLLPDNAEEQLFNYDYYNGETYDPNNIYKIEDGTE